MIGFILHYFWAKNIFTALNKMNIDLLWSDQYFVWF
jgi:hypothetical protein